MDETSTIDSPGQLWWKYIEQIYGQYNWNDFEEESRKHSRPRLLLLAIHWYYSEVLNGGADFVWR